MKQPRLMTIDEAKAAEIQQEPQITPCRFAPAYNYGWSQHLTRGDCRWDEVVDELRQGWIGLATNNGLSWEEACPAVRDGWDHVSPKPSPRLH